MYETTNFLDRGNQYFPITIFPIQIRHTINFLVHVYRKQKHRRTLRESLDTSATPAPCGVPPDVGGPFYFPSGRQGANTLYAFPAEFCVLDLYYLIKD